MEFRHSDLRRSPRHLGAPFASTLRLGADAHWRLTIWPAGSRKLRAAAVSEPAHAGRLPSGRDPPGLDLVWPWGLVALQAADGLGHLFQDVDDHDVQHPGSAAQGG